MPAHPYGPHRPGDVPATGRRWGPHHRGSHQGQVNRTRRHLEQIPLDPALVAQREQVNTRAHLAATVLELAA